MDTMPDTLLLPIERVNAYGLGVAVHAGVKYYVAGTLAGEEVEAKPLRKQGGGWNCELVRVVKASPERVSPVCGVFGICGGCDLQHASYAHQLELKEAWVREIFSRFAAVRVLKIAASAREWRYRNRVTLHHDGRAVGFRKKASHDVVAVSDCPIASEAINAQLVNLPAQILAGPDTVELREDGLRGAFAQVNTLQNQTLLDAVARFARGKKSQKILELYSGAGNLTFTLAALAKEVTAVEGDAQAVRRAEARRIAQKIKNVNFICGQAFERVYELAEKCREFETIVCDPPREGLRDVVKLLPRFGAVKVVYVSCEPHALAREASILESKGYVLKTLAPIDMFPQTRHVEVVAEFIKVSV